MFLIMGIGKLSHRSDGRNNSYYYRVDGRKVSAGSDKVKAEHKRQIAISMYSAGILKFKVAGRVKLSEAILDYNNSRENMAKKTIENDKRVLTLFEEFVGDVKLEIISLKKLNDFEVYLMKTKGMSQNGFRAYQTHLKTFFNTIHRWTSEAGKTDKKYLERNPAKYWKKVKAVERDIIILTDEQKKNILKIAKSHKTLNKVIPIMMFSGMPVAEICGQVVISSDLSVLQYRRKKTKELVSIPIGKKLKKHFHSLKIKDGIHLFSDGHGESYIHQEHKMLLILHSQFKGLTPHQYRHNFAISLLRAGIRVSVVASLLGHKDNGITVLKHYSKYVYTEKKDAMSKVG